MFSENNRTIRRVEGRQPWYLRDVELEPQRLCICRAPDASRQPVEPCLDDSVHFCASNLEAYGAP